MVPDGLSARRINLLDRSVRHYRQHGDGSSVMDSLRGTPDNYRDHLDLSLHLLDVGTRHGPGARRLMERYAAWTRLGFLRKLPRRSPDAPPELDVVALLPDAGRLYGGHPRRSAAGVRHSRGDAALRAAAKSGGLAD